jgi:hypothetical protein
MMDVTRQRLHLPVAPLFFNTLVERLIQLDKITRLCKHK